MGARRPPGHTHPRPTENLGDPLFPPLICHLSGCPTKGGYPFLKSWRGWFGKQKRDLKKIPDPKPIGLFIYPRTPNAEQR